MGIDVCVVRAVNRVEQGEGVLFIRKEITEQPVLMFTPGMGTGGSQCLGLPVYVMFHTHHPFLYSSMDCLIKQLSYRLQNLGVPVNPVCVPISCRSACVGGVYTALTASRAAAERCLPVRRFVPPACMLKKTHTIYLF